ncbi:MAG: VWA domain-containing protein [Chromatiales bacterium]|nr:VWA domain-containing protein [Chromatiales bacterium]
MFSFQWPWFALLLLMPIGVALFWPRRISRTDTQHHPALGTTLLHPSLRRLQASFNSQPPSERRGNTLHLLLLTLLWSALTLALMRPQWLEPHSELKATGYDLMLAIDTSRSMTALDFSKNNQPLSRMAVVKGVMGRFIEQRQGDRIGLLIFGNLAFTLSPLTLDVGAVQQLLQEISPGMAGNATAIGDAIGLGVKKLRTRPAGSRVLILVTDGENTAGLIPPLAAARMAAHAGIRSYAIGVGSNQKEV